MVVSYQQELPIEGSGVNASEVNGHGYNSYHKENLGDSIYRITKAARTGNRLGWQCFSVGNRRPATREVSVKRSAPERSIDYSFRGTEVSKKYKCRARIGAGRTDEIARRVAG